MHSIKKNNKIGLKIVSVVLLLITTGILLTFQTFKIIDNEFRNNILLHARIAAQGIKADKIQRLKGDQSDLKSSDYLILKEQLKLIKKSNNDSKFVYLMGQKPDGKLFFFVDSEPVGSKEESYPGQIYDEATLSLMNAFESTNEIVEGPVTDRWGTFISALIPIYDTNAITLGLSKPEDAKKMVKNAIEYCKKNGKNNFLTKVNNPHSEFVNQDLYVYVYDKSMTMLAHPVKPELVGKNQIDQKDWSGGKYFRKEIQEVALSKGNGWVEYRYENPITKKLDYKKAYIEKVDDIIICTGVYQGTGRIIAVFGMDIDAKNWKKTLIKSSRIPLIISIFFIVIIVIGIARKWIYYLEPTLTFTIGLMLTFFTASTLNQNENYIRKQIFSQLALSRTSLISESLKELRDTEILIKGLAHFYEGSQNVTSDEFRNYTYYLTENSAVKTWKWIPIVNSSDKDNFENNVKKGGLKNFKIWQKDKNGNPEPAFGREKYYPILRIAPLNENEDTLGYDLGSDPLQLQAIEESLYSELNKKNDITIMQNNKIDDEMLIYHTVFENDKDNNPIGFVLASLNKGLLLKSRKHENAILIELSLFHQNDELEPIASEWDLDHSPPETLSITSTINVFDKIFAVTAYAGPNFINLHPKKAGRIAALIGLFLTTIITIMLHLILRRREELEKMVIERTSRLQESEERQSATLKSIGDGVIACDKDGLVTNLNYIAEKLTGWSAKDAIGEKIEVVFNIIDEVTQQPSENLVKKSLLLGSIVGISNKTILISKDGEKYNIAENCSPIRNINGEIIGAVLTFRDVTSEYAIRQNMEQTNALLTAVIEQSLVPMALVTKENSLIIVFNQACLDFFGEPNENFTGKSLNEISWSWESRKLNDKIIPPEESPISKALRGEATHSEEQKIIDKNGNVRFNVIEGVPIKNTEGKVVAGFIIFTDITDIKNAEEKLRLNSLVLDQIEDLVTITDLKGIITYVNHAEAKTLGFSKDELLGKTTEIYGNHPEKGLSQKAFLEKTLRNGAWRNELVNYTNDGTKRIMDCRTQIVHSTDGKPIAICGISTDITERKKAEEELIRQSRLRQLLMDISSTYINLPTSKMDSIIIDSLSNIANFVDADRSYVFEYDFAKGIAINTHKWYNETIHIDSEKENLATISLNSFTEATKAHLKGEAFYLPDVFAMPENMTRNLLETQGIKSLLLIPMMSNKNCVGFVGFDSVSAPHFYPEDEINLLKVFAELIVNVQLRKLSEIKHARLMSAVEQATEVFVITDTAGTILYVNPAFEKVTGYKSFEAIGKNPKILKSGKHDESFYKDMWDKLMRGDTWKGRITNRRKDGKQLIEEAVISPVLNEEGKTIHYVAVKRDITEQLKTSEMLQQAQKMDSIGRLAGGVAHDFNNMLGVILGYTELAMSRVEPEERIFTDLQEIRKAAEHSADLTRQLLAFARKQNVDPKILDLNETVEGMLKILRRLIGEHIALVWLPGKNIGTVNMDPSQIYQILANLCVNAHDSIKDSGQVIIETSSATFDDNYCTSHVGAVPGDYVLLIVSDNGCGMNKETLSKLFEPFFTTKEMGKGTGLGLSTIYGIVKQNNGFIYVYSEIDKGSTFKIYMPLYSSKTQTIKNDDKQETCSLKRETILLVEDEPSILTLTTMMLEDQGYFVLSAATPRDALRLANEHNGKIDLLLTDVIMPEMNGRKLAENLFPLYPNMKMLFMSGYTASVISIHGVLDEGINFIQKPFSRKHLIQKVKEAIGSNN